MACRVDTFSSLCLFACFLPPNLLHLCECVVSSSGAKMYVYEYIYVCMYVCLLTGPYSQLTGTSSPPFYTLTVSVPMVICFHPPPPPPLYLPIQHSMLSQRCTPACLNSPWALSSVWASFNSGNGCFPINLKHTLYTASSVASLSSFTKKSQ